MRVVEFTGGSTGSSLAMVCAMKGYDFHPLSSDAFSAEKLDTMRAFGADLELVPSDGGKVTPALFDRFTRPHCRTDEGPEHLLDQSVRQRGRARGLRQHRPRAWRSRSARWTHSSAPWARPACWWVCRARSRKREVRPASSPSNRRLRILTPGKGGAHRVEGTAAGIWPPRLKPGSYDEARAIDEEEGRAMARRVAREEGIFAGTSSGLNLVGALNLARELGPGKVVATVGVRDTGLKYLAGDL